MNKKICVEYVWIDGLEEVRSKLRVLELESTFDIDNYKNYLKIKKDEHNLVPIAIHSKIDLFNGMFGRIDNIIKKGNFYFYL